MGDNHHSPYQDNVTKFRAEDMNGPLSELDEALTLTRNLSISTGGSVDWDDATGTLSWDAAMTIHFVRPDGNMGINTIAVGSIALAADEMAYVDLDTVGTTSLTVSKAAYVDGSASPFVSAERVVLGFRHSTDNIFIPVYLSQALGVGGGGVGAFVDCSDTPANFTGAGNKALAVKGTEDGVEFVPFPTIMNAYKFPMEGGYPEANYIASVSSSAYAHKGNIVTPLETITLYGVACLLDSSVDSASYHAVVAPISGSVLGDVISSATFNNTGTAGKWVWGWFDSPVVLSPGTTYAIGFGRTDGLGTDALEIHWPSSIYDSTVPMVQEQGWRMADASPANGESVSLVATCTVPFRYIWSAPGVPSVTPKPYVQTVTYGATMTPNLGDGDMIDITLAGNPTINLAGGEDGQVMTLRLRQDATGGRTVTWGSMCRFSSDVPEPTLSTSASALDYIAFRYNQTDGKYDCMAVNLGF